MWGDIVKKILLLSLSASLFVAPLLAVAPQQSLFADTSVHKPVPIDAEKLAAAELIISAEKKMQFCYDLVDLYIKGKFVRNDIISPLSEDMIIELLKEHKNGLIQEIGDQVDKRFYEHKHLGSYVLERLAVSMTLPIFLLFLLGKPFTADCKTGHTYGKAEFIIYNALFKAASLLCFVGSLYAAYEVIMYRNYIRSREQKMNYIDEVIEKLDMISIK